MRFKAGQAVARAGIDMDRLAWALPRVDPNQIVVRPASRLFRLFWGKGITAVAMPWGIYVHPARLGKGARNLGRLMVHELAHIDQWRRLGALGWARSYLGDYLRGRWAGLKHFEAYRAIGLEEEARAVASRIVG